jgi:signal transduction histidine kinase
VDSRQMQIVFGNLIRNACEAMPEGGRLTVRGALADGAVEVSVGDTGVGIPNEDLLRVMEPLYSTKARGLGMGLALARAILEKNQGSLRVVSTLGQGTTFTVRLVRAE